ncbi:sulfate transporter [Peziza echinospora]|nr:sulfate transporter [Peziza echinospora]
MPFNFGTPYQNVRSAMNYNYRTFKQNPWGEITGSLGDLGTFLPVVFAMERKWGLVSLNSTLIFSGLANILSGAFFGVPVVVQPMMFIASKSLLRDQYSPYAIGAGLSVGVVVLLLAVTGLLERVGKIVPVPIVKGIQLGAALSILINAGFFFNELPWLGLPWVGLDPDTLIWVAFATLFFLGRANRNKKIPSAVILLTYAILYSMVARLGLPEPGIELPHLRIPFLRLVEIKNGLLAAGIVQLPLTISNSVIAVTQLSHDLLPTRPAPSPTSLGISIGLMNIVGCMFNGMPICFGSGGYAAQYRYGARSGAGVMLLGVVMVLFGLMVGSPPIWWLRAFSETLLNILLFAAGIDLASTVAQTLNASSHSTLEANERWLVMLVTAGGLLVFKDSWLGLALGVALWIVLRLQDKAAEYFARRNRSGGGETQPLLS